ncbi:RagB/SusD family nutrient uptake outer membrane protein [Flavobacterium acetivorans]|uniref:RagB/SusD family nutrient uptake outer membrane protein n=1 Tax=Flavobacterium acetivorans TaxID=2893883 RepID=UPI001E4474FF|nr:RagB/SusD family nutrient uptake outer membrane protein [Flavobacterium sp. F-29]UFH36848.1 RagB/SusD family nutrient uptake outer membrane protein [Flavobacterium sp. F-29]
MKKILIFSLAISVFLISCESDYLDARPDGGTTTDSQLDEIAKVNPKVLNGLLLGVYSTMYTVGAGGTDDHSDFGQKGVDITLDLLSSDMAYTANNYGWYNALTQLTATPNFANNENYKPWRYYYKIILGANSVIDALGGTDAVLVDQEAKNVMGQAKGLRAYAYFYLSQMYQISYKADELILPIYKDAKSNNQPKSKASEVYDLMISDLTQSIAYLDGYTRSAKFNLDKNVAKGLLAYVYAARGTTDDLTKIVSLTNDILAAYPLTTKSQSTAVLANGVLTNSDSGFNNVNTPSWMWGVDLTNAINLDLISWWGQMDYYTYSYSWAGDPKGIDRDLLLSIPTTDIRRAQFSSGSFRPLGKFFDPKRVVGGQRVIETDYIYMRSDEFLLLNAEANAKLNNEGAAIDSLKKLLAIRFASALDYAYVDALGGDALKDEIYKQMRVELWGEGKIYLAMKRNKRSSTRASNHLNLKGQTFTYDDPRLSFLIPQQEVLNNPFID